MFAVYFTDKFKIYILFLFGIFFDTTQYDKNTKTGKNISSLIITISPYMILMCLRFESRN